MAAIQQPPALSDEDFLEASELPFFLRALLSQLATAPSALKTEEALDFAEGYFQSVLSCHHVLGAEYSYICGSKYNRRAFVYCLLESFSSLSDDEDLTPADYQQLVDVICPDMPRHIIYEAAYAVETSSAPNSTTNKYSHKKLRLAIFFHIVYEDWLKLVENFCRDEGSSGAVHVNKLKLFLEHARVSISPYIDHPPKAALEATFQSVTKSHNSEITYDGMRRNLFKSPIIEEELTRRPKSALPLSKDETTTVPPSSSSSSLEAKLGDATD